MEDWRKLCILPLILLILYFCKEELGRIILGSTAIVIIIFALFIYGMKAFL